MNDEIKEIIEYFKDDIDFLEEELKYPNFKGRYITIRDKECDYLRKLLDYITNLQEEKEYYKFQLQQKENIIKEVREILKQDKASASFNTAERNALEILDKEGEDNDTK